MKKGLNILICLMVSLALYGQSFEGFITYKMEVMNPNPEMIADDVWQAELKSQLGEQGYIVQKYYYKMANYMSEISTGKETGYQLYNPKDGLLYAWEANATTAVTENSKNNFDEVEEIVDVDKKETILGIECKSIILKSQMGEMTIYYNPEHFKMDASLFKGHKYGHYEQMLKKTGCLPLKIENKSFMTHTVQTAIAFEKIAIDDKKFELPKFTEITSTDAE